MMTSAAEMPSPLWMSTGMPRPSSVTVTELSALSVTCDGGGVSCQRLVDGVVDDFIDHVMQARAVIGVADIHARALAHGVEAFQNPNQFRAILDGRSRLGVGKLLPGRFVHERPSKSVPKSAEDNRG